MIPKSKVLLGLAPHLMKPKPSQAQAQHQHQRQDQNQSQAQNVEVKIFPNVTEYKPEDKIDDTRIVELEAECNHYCNVIDVYDRITELMQKYDARSEMVICEDDLKFIIKKMTGCNEVDIQYEDGGCLGICSRTVDKIHLIYGDLLYNIKYNYENLIKFLKQKKISWKEVR
jgi:hypothetical protein